MLSYQEISAGDVIVSSPTSSNLGIFEKSAILIISHNKTGTAGMIINKMLSTIDGEVVLKAKSPNNANDESEIKPNLPVYFGGPVEQDKGIIVHSEDYKGDPILSLSNGIVLSADLKIMSDIMSGNGPKQKMLMLGYASWRPGQLIQEINNNDWLLLLRNKQSLYEKDIYNLVFLEENIYRWQKGLKMAGINLASYSGFIGHA